MSNAVRTFAVAVVCVVGVSAAVLAGWIEPCCNVKGIDMRTRTVTVTEKATGCTYEFQAKSAADLDGLKVGGAIALNVKLLVEPVEPINGASATPSVKPAEPVGTPARTVKPAEPVNGATASAATSSACGSNVGRNAKTKTLCKRMTGPNSWEYVAC